jgi:nitroimidazol reductase NimA-like FMN-containing flavoprotein (pyridoxamine 5'-phosphate oxidase superfamily)
MAVYDVDMSATQHDRGIDFLEISRDGCMRLLAAASGGVGRIALSVSPAMIRPVNFALDDQTQSVVFRSALGSKLREGLSSGPAAFEIDGTDAVDQTGWSVIITGEAEEVTEPAEIERLEDFDLESWAPGVKTHWVRIRATSASGRRIVHDLNYY